MIYLVPAAGKGERFKADFPNTPKPFLEIDNTGKRMLQYVLDQCPKRISNADRNVIFNVEGEEYLRETDGADMMWEFNPSFMRTETKGPADTLLAFGRGLSPEDFYALKDQPVIISACDNIVHYPYELLAGQCQGVEADAGLFVFPSGNPAYSYINEDNFPLFTATREKHVISPYAIAGVQYFKSFGFMLAMLEEHERLYKEWGSCEGKLLHKDEPYISHVFNVLLDAGFKALAVWVDEKMVDNFGTPEELKLRTMKGYTTQ